MKIYGLTSLGKKQARKDLNGIEMKILRYLRDNKTATEDELEIVGGERWLMRRMKSSGLVIELTN